MMPQRSPTVGFTRRLAGMLAPPTVAVPADAGNRHDDVGGAFQVLMS
jgi:hypothetical protein